MKSKYKTEDGKRKIMQLHYAQLEKLEMPYEEIMVNTRYGKTSVLVTGNPEGKPLMIFHGHNITNAYTTMQNKFLLKDYRIYAPNILGQAGNSEDGKQIPGDNYQYSYGKWAKDVIEALGLKKTNCFGNSFGAGIINNLVCYAPEVIDHAVMHVPTSFFLPRFRSVIPLGISNGNAKKKGQIDVLTKNTIKLCGHNGIADEDLIEMNNLVSMNCAVVQHIPGLIHKKDLVRCTAPVMILYSEYDIMYPPEKVKRILKEYFPQCERHMLKGYGHSPYLPEQAKKRILEFFQED